MIEISPLQQADRADWEVLARGYMAFYNTTMSDADYERTWQRLLRGDEVHGLAARLNGKLVGITHYLFHGNIWLADSCYLQDLFVDEAARGHGAARALIDSVAKAARDRGAQRLYWHTHQGNDRARALYDKVTQYGGFVSYVMPIMG